MDTVEQLLTDIQSKLEELQGPIPWSFGRRARNEIQAPPCIAWVELPGSFDKLEKQKIGGIGGGLGNLVCNLELLIWDTDRERCRIVLLNLNVASRALAGTSFQWRDFAFTNEGGGNYTKDGWQLVAHVDVKLPIPAEASPYAEVLTAEHEGFIGSVWGMFSWGDGHTWGGEAVC